MQSLERISAWVFGLAFLLLALAVAVETIMRKVFNKSLQGVDELGGYVLAVGAALSFAIALRQRTHIRIDVVHERLPKAVRVMLNALALPSLLACAAAVLYMAWFALGETIQFNATAQTPWATPLRYPQTAWVIALAVFALFALVETGVMLRTLVSGRITEMDHRYGPRGAKDELDEELADLKARGIVDVPASHAGTTGGVRS
jgi:TRAP-type C4-dicarboxylate transport system permease small subunit